MKQTFFAVFISLVFAVSAWAGPFLVTNPQENVTSYMVTIDGVTQEEPAFDLGDGTTILHFDLDAVTDGDHNCTVASKNMWGESETLPFQFSKMLPESVSVLDISAQ